MAHFLVVDDDEPTRDLIAFSLEQLGHSVTRAENGDEALAAFAGKRADVVITDLLMPDRDGLELIPSLLKLAPTMPIIAISGSVQHAGLYLKMARQLGATWSLSKPFSRDELVAAVEAA